jgi:hypothetical protein
MGSKMKNMLSKEAEKLENLKMWLQEQIERYGALIQRNAGTFSEIAHKSRKDAYETVLARLTEDEK